MKISNKILILIFVSLILSITEELFFFPTEDNLDEIENICPEFLNCIENVAVENVHPNMFLNDIEIDKIKDEINTGKEPWKSSFYGFEKIVRNNLKITPESVVLKGKIPPSGDVHDYYTDELYIKDGIVNQSADRADFGAISNISKTVRNLGLLYVFTGNTSYANYSIELIDVWTVNSSTKMNPNFTNRQSRIDISSNLPAMFYGADLIWNYPGWNQSDKAIFKNWTRSLLFNVTNINISNKGIAENNFENWRLVLISSASVIAEDQKARKYAFDRWKQLISIQMNPDGSLKNELIRKDSLTYSTFALNGMIQTAIIARHYNTDLYNYVLSDGRGLEKSLDFYAPYIIQSSKWNYPQIHNYNGENAFIYEFVSSFFKSKNLYMEVIKKWKRPIQGLKTTSQPSPQCTITCIIMAP